MTCPVCSGELGIINLISCANIPEEVKESICYEHLQETINAIKTIRKDGSVQIASEV